MHSECTSDLQNQLFNSSRQRAHFLATIQFIEHKLHHKSIFAMIDTYIHTHTPTAHSRFSDDVMFGCGRTIIFLCRRYHHFGKLTISKKRYSTSPIVPIEKKRRCGILIDFFINWLNSILDSGVANISYVNAEFRV